MCKQAPDTQRSPRVCDIVDDVGRRAAVPREVLQEYRSKPVKAELVVGRPAACDRGMKPVQSDYPFLAAYSLRKHKYREEDLNAISTLHARHDLPLG
ncbi:hypothetical protein Hypma_003695 [Hypsizygus marmoreus]|uniref:Uncharacterized protein n=1 Tax=Hypsizygus marmoreus TaxID=39966 RepID=A0A369J183_HYPMA|nr:hypothetical protein Hypma_003695 [Hypsizygus marmoreus]